MIPVRQTIFVDTSENGHGNCMAACLASLFEVPISEVVDTASDEVHEKGWWKQVFSWVNERGFRLDHVTPDNERLLGRYSIGYGQSPRGDFQHAIVCKSGRMIWDPHPSDDGVLAITGHDLIEPVDETPKKPKRKKFCHIGAPACFALELCAKHLVAAFGGNRCYVVGSVLERPDWRDVDVRFMLTDDEFKTLFPDVPNIETGTWERDARWLLVNTALSEWLSRQTGLPVDFQFQPTTWANTRHAKTRNPIGLTYASPRKEKR